MWKTAGSRAYHHEARNRCTYLTIGNIGETQNSKRYVHTNRQNIRTSQGGSEATILFDAPLITPEALYAAFRGLRKKASAGVDGVTYQKYEKGAARNIQQLHERLKEGKYRAQPLL
jgi:hypothetical protein